jgi:hypothetical protein
MTGQVDRATRNVDRATEMQILLTFRRPLPQFRFTFSSYYSFTILRK